MKKKQRIILLIGAVVMGIFFTACQTNIQPKGKDKGFKTPEELMVYFADQVSKGDLEGAAEVFAMNQMAENFDLGKYIDRIQSWQPTGNISYPSEDKAFLQANKAILKGDNMRQIANLCLSLNADEEYLEGAPVQLTNKDGNDIAESFLLENMESFKFVEMDYVDDEARDTDNYKKSIKINNEIYGSNGYEEYEVYYEWDGDDYRGSVTLIKYDGLWYIFSLKSLLAGDYLFGYLERI